MKLEKWQWLNSVAVVAMLATTFSYGLKGVRIGNWDALVLLINAWLIYGCGTRWGVAKSKIPAKPETDDEKIAKGLLVLVTTRPNWDVIGEWLRQITFIGDGVGCCENFNVRSGAVEWTEEQRRDFIKAENLSCEELVEEAIRDSHGYTYQLGSIQVEVFWWWDGDGELVFRVTGDQTKYAFAVRNTDCKKDYGWERI